MVVEYRWAEGRYERLAALAKDLVGRKVDVIAAIGPPCASAAKNATSTIPIVFTTGSDPVRDGLVASLSRPGGNLTGISILAVQLVPKRLELLSELVPQARVLALLVNPNNGYAEPMVRDVQEAARAKGVQLKILNASTIGEIDAAFANLVKLHADGLVIGDDPFFVARQEQLVSLASRYAIPATYQFREFPAAGGLVSYGPSCLVPECRGISHADPTFREALWDRYFTAAPRPRTPSELRYSDRRLRSKNSPGATTSTRRQ